jgi:ankyrin repeat protein
MLENRCKDGRTPLVMLDKNMKTILHHACEEGDILIVKNLVTAGAVLNAQDVKGYTPLHYACEKGLHTSPLCMATLRCHYVL